MRKKSLSKQLAILWSKFLAVLIQMGGFVSYINPNITGENFPLQDEDLEFKPVEVFSIKEYLKSLGRTWLSTAEVVAYLAGLGYRPATLLELLLWWLANPAKQANCLVVALGQVYYDDYVPCANGFDDERKLCLYSVKSDWYAHYEFAAVKLEKKAA